MRKSSSSNYFLSSNYFYMEGDTKFKTSELLDCKHVEKYKLYSRKKERKKSHIQQEKTIPHTGWGNNRKTLTSTLSSMVITMQLWD